MGNVSLKRRLSYLLLEPHYPHVGIEFASDCLRLAAITADKDRVFLQHFDSEELPVGCVEVNPFKPNVQKPDLVSEALKSLWTRNRFKSSKVCLLLQDRCALTFHTVLEQPASSREECIDLIRFKLRKSVPFHIEEAQVCYFDPSGAMDHAASQLWVTLMHQTVLRQYEHLIESSVSAECGLVDLSTFNLLNLGDWEVRNRGLQDQDLLFVNLNRDSVSVAITQKSQLTFYRSRALEKQNGILEEALAEIHPITMYYVDKLGGSSLTGVFVYSPEYSNDLGAGIEKSLQLESFPLSPERFADTQFDPSTLRYLRAFAPLIGMMVSRKPEFL